MKKIIPAWFLMLASFAVTAQDKVNKETQTQVVRWTISNNYSKSDNGQLFIQLPVQSALSCIVNKTGEAKSFALHNETPKELPPANYDVTFWGIRIPAVAVEKRKDTRILAGVLNSMVKAPWEVWTADGIKVYSAGGPKQVALPPGDYVVKTGGAEIKITITDGKVSIFNFRRD